MTSMVLEALLALAAVFSLLRLPFQWVQPEASHPAVLRSQPTFPSTAPDPLHLWHLPFPEVRNDTAGYPVLPPSVVSHTVLFTADASSAQYPGTFNHHPHVVAVNGSALLLLSFSNGLHDEDADGQQVLYAASQDAGASFSPLLPLFPPALLPGERPSYNVSTTSLQRALCSEGFVQLRDGRLYALAEAFGVSNVTGVAGEGVGFKATGYGRVARPLSPRDGSVAGPACWVQPSRFARALAGTPYDERRMAACDDRAELVALLSQAGTEPAWSWAALSDDHYIHASEAASQVQEPTFGVPFAGPSICRFWRLKSASTNRSLYVECAASADPRYNGWFNGTDEAGQGWYGPYSAIVPSDVPDSGSKEFLSTLPAPFTHVLISNTKHASPTPPRLSLCGGWMRDLTRECVEANPGPPQVEVSEFKFDGNDTNAIEVFSTDQQDNHHHVGTIASRLLHVRKVFQLLQDARQLVPSDEVTWTGLRNFKNVDFSVDDGEVPAGKYAIVTGQQSTDDSAQLGRPLLRCTDAPSSPAVRVCHAIARISIRARSSHNSSSDSHGAYGSSATLIPHLCSPPLHAQCAWVH